MVTFPMTPGSFQPGHWLFGLARTACILAVAAVLTALWTGPAGATGQALPSSSFGRPGAPSSSNALTRCGQYRVPVGQLSVATNGTLFYVAGGELRSEIIHTLRGNYGAYYQGVHDAIRNGGEAPVTTTEAIRVMTILELAARSDAMGIVMRMPDASNPPLS